MIRATIGILASQGGLVIPLLDTYTGAAAAYSLRKLRSAYTGSAIRVRIDTTGQPEYNIGFVNNELDTATLEGYCTGGLNAFVTIWYDQSGNSRDATQTTAANQPQIVTGGSVLIQNSKPCIYPLAIQGLNTNFTDTNVGTILKHLFIVADTTASAANTLNYQSALFGSYSGSGSIGNSMILGYYTAEPTIKYRNYDGSKFVLNASSTSGYKLWQSLRDSSLLYIGENNSTYISGGTPNTNYNATNYFIGGYAGAGANNSPKLIQEVIYYPSSQLANLVGIQTNINDFYSIY